jgi:6-pyruvoyl-tetrahydropterin synthase
MVEKSVVIDTIKRMHSNGIDENTIKVTLKGIGLTEEEIDDYLDEVLGTEEEPEEENPEHEVIAKKAFEKFKPELDKVKEEHGLNSTHSQIEREEHSRKLDEMNSKVNELSKNSLKSFNSSELIGKINALEKKLNEIEKNTVETKAASSALQNLMQKILSTERDILLELKNKK